MSDWYYNTRTKEYRMFPPGSTIPIEVPGDLYPWVNVDMTDAPFAIPEGYTFFKDITDEMEKPESILSEAKRLVEGGERNQSYGPPEMDFKRIAGMWTALFEEKLKPGVVFDPADVARAQICLKLSRSTWQKKRDNWTDQAGYAACGHRCETGEW